MSDQQLPGDERSPEDERGCDVDLRRGHTKNVQLGQASARTSSQSTRAAPHGHQGRRHDEHLVESSQD